MRSFLQLGEYQLRDIQLGYAVTELPQKAVRPMCCSVNRRRRHDLPALTLDIDSLEAYVLQRFGGPEPDVVAAGGFNYGGILRPILDIGYDELDE